MMDQVEQLEQHVETLLKLLESAKVKITEVVRENDALKEKLEGCNHVDAENQELQAQVKHLESEVSGMTNKESQIRERLQAILSKIDTIENELTSAGGMD